MEWFIKVVEKYAHEDNCWMETSSKVTDQKVQRMRRKVSPYIFGIHGSAGYSRLRNGAWRKMLEKITRKGDFNRTREHAEIAEVWKRSIYNTIVIIHVFPPPRVQM